MSANFLTPKNWDNVTDNGRNKLVFQNRNHDYGAYTIRRDYNHHLFLALFISTGIFLSAFIIPKLLFSNSTSEIVIPTIDPIVTIIDITPPTAIIEELTPPAVIEKPKVEIATQDNTTPVVVDNKVDNTLSTNDKIINPGKTNTTGVIGDPVIDKPFIETPIVKVEPPPTIMLAPEVMPVFPGGEAALFRYLQNNINYPYSAKENGIKGTVIVGFVIDVTGKPVMLSILKGIRGGKDLEVEAMRVIAGMPNWSIGKQNDKPVPVQFSLPVRFDLR
jgi:periplasmic protein TonB